ncbi:MAG: hypothetical protein AAF436_15575 [Myxococcota bacterium]
MSYRLRNLAGDCRGSVLTLSLFMALFVIGAMYYIVGVGDAILYRRAMQDAADAGAFSAAIVAAKGMNLHVLLNIVMAITAGILLVLRSVEVLLEIVLGVLQGLVATIVFSIKATALIAALTPVEQTVERIGDGVEQFVRVAHDAIDVAHDAVQRGFPSFAQLRAVNVMGSDVTQESPVVGGFVVPLLGPPLPKGGPGLPVEEGSLGSICNHVADGLGRRLNNVSSKVPTWLKRFLGGLVSKTLGLGKRRTCTDDIVEPPRVVIRERSDGTRVWLGQEEFQYRSYSWGRDPHVGRWQRGELGLRLAQGGRASGRGSTHDAHAIGRVGFAQAEYYFDGDAFPEEWMWRQRWRARLRRFRVSREWVPDRLVEACGSAASGHGFGTLCDVVRDFALNAVSVH